MYTIKVSQFPSSSGYGEPVQKFLKFKDGEKIVDSFGVKANQGLGLTDTLTHTLVGGEELVFFTKEGKGAKYKLDWGDGLKKNGKRLMKVRDGDVVTSVCKVAPRYLMVTKRGLGLIIPGAEVPERGAGAMGVVLMGISDDDSGVGIVAVNKGLKEIRLHIDGGGEKIVPIGDFTSGHRALKGKKVITRGSIIAIDGAHV